MNHSIHRTIFPSFQYTNLLPHSNQLYNCLEELVAYNNAYLNVSYPNIEGHPTSANEMLRLSL